MRGALGKAEKLQERQVNTLGSQNLGVKDDLSVPNFASWIAVILSSPSLIKVSNSLFPTCISIQISLHSDWRVSRSTVRDSIFFVLTWWRWTSCMAAARFSSHWRKSAGCGNGRGLAGF